METYQDVWVRGAVRKQGRRACAKRYDAMRQLLNSYGRRFTVLDIGAHLGYFSFRIATDYDAVAVMVDVDPRLPGMCVENGLPHIIALRHRLSVADLRALADCEHFDVVLALSVLHHFGDWRGAADAVLAMGDHVIIETPPPEDKNACGQSVVPALHEYLSAQPRKLLTRTQSHTSPGVVRPMWLFSKPKTTLARAYVDVPEKVHLSPMTIASGFLSKRVRFRDKDEERDWLHGINLRTYERLGGAWPSPSHVADLVAALPLPDVRHGDIRTWNMVFDGKEVNLIDGHDRRAIYEDAPSLADCASAIRSLDEAAAEGGAA